MQRSDRIIHRFYSHSSIFPTTHTQWPQEPPKPPTDFQLSACNQKAHTDVKDVFVQKPVQVHNDIAEHLFSESLEPNVWQHYSYTFPSILQAKVLIR